MPLLCITGDRKGRPYKPNIQRKVFMKKLVFSLFRRSRYQLSYSLAER